jgi:hypothetical protein
MPSSNRKKGTQRKMKNIGNSIELFLENLQIEFRILDWID